MPKEFNVGKKVQEAGAILGALGVIGFIGIIWLMIYGNLSGNLGWSPDSSSYINETLPTNLSEAGATPAGASGRIDGVISNVIMTNATGGEVITAATNYTVVGVIISSIAGASYNNTAVNVSYDVAYDSQNEINTDAVMTNITGGFLTFFGFSNTFFTIAAIVLLIFMLVGLLALVWMIVSMQRGKSSGYSGN